MELRNVRRFYLTGKGLRIWRKKYGGGVVLSTAGLKCMYCLYFNVGVHAAGTIRDKMTLAGNSSAGVKTVENVLNAVVKTGYISKSGGRYGLTTAGKLALNDIEKCIRRARPDR